MTPFAIVQDLYRAMREQDDPAVHRLCSPSIVWEQSPGFPGGGVRHGPQEVIDKVFRANAQRWTGFAFTSDEFIEAAGRVIVLGRYSGTAASTGKAMNTIVAHVYEVEGQQISRFRMFADTQPMWQALAE